ncbi:hypothetical protein D3C86_1274080 [compost metagenome]
MRSQGQPAVIVIDTGGIFRLCDRDQSVNGNVCAADAGVLGGLRRRLCCRTGRTRFAHIQYRGRNNVISGFACILVVQYHTKGVHLAGRGGITGLQRDAIRNEVEFVPRLAQVASGVVRVGADKGAAIGEGEIRIFATSLQGSLHPNGVGGLRRRRAEQPEREHGPQRRLPSFADEHVDVSLTLSLCGREVSFDTSTHDRRSS